MEVRIRASNRCKVIPNAWKIGIKNRCPAGTSVLSYRSFGFTPYGVTLRMTIVGAFCCLIGIAKAKEMTLLSEHSLAEGQGHASV
jgi:hypothetical protein